MVQKEIWEISNINMLAQFFKFEITNLNKSPLQGENIIIIFFQNFKLLLNLTRMKQTCFQCGLEWFHELSTQIRLLQAALEIQQSRFWFRILNNNVE